MIDSLITYRDRFAQRYLATKDQQHIGVIAFLAALMLLVCAFSYFFFMGQSLRLDESQSLWQTSRSALGVFYIVAQDVHPPLYHQILHLWLMWVNDSVQGARFLSLIYFLISIPALYLLGKKSYNRSVGLWTALLFAVSPFMNWYGNEIRMYSLLTLFTILNQYFFVKLWKDASESTKTGKKSDTWFWYAITALAGIYTQYFFFLVLATQALFYFMRQDLFPKGTFKKFCIVVGILAVTYIPWVAYVIHQNQIGSQTPNLLLPTSVDLFSVFQQFIFGFQNLITLAARVGLRILSITAPSENGY
jgi:mannosyltransferase